MMNWRRLRDQEAPCRLKAATTPVQGLAFHACRQVQLALSGMCTICTLSATLWSVQSRLGFVVRHLQAGTGSTVRSVCSLCLAGEVCCSAQRTGVDRVCLQSGAE